MKRSRQSPHRHRTAARAGGVRHRRRPRPTGRASAKPRSLPGNFAALAGAKPPVAGLGVCVAVAEAFGTGTDVKTSRMQAFVRGRRAAQHPDAILEQAAKRLCRGNLKELAETLAALGSSHRLAILADLLEGPATYRALQRRTALKAGPLYHHINQLRLANLVGPKSRDVYVLTRAGRNALLAVLALGPLLKDGRPRPVAGA